MSYYPKCEDANNYFHKKGVKMKNGTIYLITNKINNKKYVGQTIQSPNVRFLYHLNYAEKDYNISNMPISKAINKYGRENFEMTILEQCEESKLDEREIYYIELYDTFNNGYNATKGDKRGVKLNLDMEKVVSDYHKLRSLRKVAAIHGVDKDCIAERLRAIGIQFYTKSEQINSNIKIYKDKEFIASFNCKKDCAEWFVKNKIPRSLKVDSVRRAIKNTKNYYGYEIVISDKI